PAIFTIRRMFSSTRSGYTSNAGVSTFPAFSTRNQLLLGGLPFIGIHFGICEAGSLNFKKRLNFHRDVSVQRSHAHRAAAANPRVRPEHVCEQFAAPVDHRRMLLKIRRAV